MDPITPTTLPKINTTLPGPSIYRQNPRYMYDTWAVLPCGSVTLSTGNMHTFKETTMDFWNHNGKVTSFLLCEVRDASPVIIMTSCTDIEVTRKHYPVGKRFEARHDQELYELGVHEVVGVYPNTLEGLAQIKEKVGRATVRAACFK